MSPRVTAYLIYLLISMAITVGVGQTLHRHGRLFITNCVRGDVHLADRVNDLLLVGFYLTNMAFVLLMLRSRGGATNWGQVPFLLSDKLGLVLSTLGLMHFLNVTALILIRHRTRC
ncbi:MAG: hypothetical protein U0872_13230 [Planctomycetaceae bacterium]